MHRRKPSQISIFFTYTFGLAVTCLAIYTIGGRSAWQMTLFFFGVGLFCLARALFFQMDADAEVREYHRLVNAELDDPNLLLIKALSQLSQSQVELIKSNIIQINTLPTTSGPQQFFNLPGAMPDKAQVSESTLRKFIAHSSPDYCAPLREFSDGVERQEVYNLMDWLSFQGHIQRQPSGRYPAAWQPGAYFTVSKMFGYSVKAEELCQKQTR